MSDQEKMEALTKALMVRAVKPKPVKVRKVLCPVCRGSTYDGADDCRHCGGVGYLVESR